MGGECLIELGGSCCHVGFEWEPGSGSVGSAWRESFPCMQMTSWEYLLVSTWNPVGCCYLFACLHSLFLSQYSTEHSYSLIRLEHTGSCWNNYMGLEVWNSGAGVYLPKSVRCWFLQLRGEVWLPCETRCGQIRERKGLSADVNPF